MISRRSFLAYLSAAVPVVAIAPSVLEHDEGGILIPGLHFDNPDRLRELFPRSLYAFDSVTYGDTDIVTGNFRSAPVTDEWMTFDEMVKKYGFEVPA